MSRDSWQDKKFSFHSLGPGVEGGVNSWVLFLQTPALLPLSLPTAVTYLNIFNILTLFGGFFLLQNHGCLSLMGKCGGSQAMGVVNLLWRSPARPFYFRGSLFLIIRYFEQLQYHHFVSFCRYSWRCFHLWSWICRICVIPFSSISGSIYFIENVPYVHFIFCDY